MKTYYCVNCHELLEIDNVNYKWDVKSKTQCNCPVITRSIPFEEYRLLLDKVDQLTLVGTICKSCIIDEPSTLDEEYIFSPDWLYLKSVVFGHSMILGVLNDPGASGHVLDLLFDLMYGWYRWYYGALSEYKSMFLTAAMKIAANQESESKTLQKIWVLRLFPASLWFNRNTPKDIRKELLAEMKKRYCIDPDGKVDEQVSIFHKKEQSSFWFWPDWDVNNYEFDVVNNCKV
jgi:hypothetical protein